MKKFDKHYVVKGKSVNLRAATPEDAGFVYQMRTNKDKTTFLNKVDGGIEQQRQWLTSCYADPYQVYFIITAKNNSPLGLVRIYDQQGDSFCWGSWLIKEDAPSTTAIESALLIYRYALDIVGFKNSHFDVRIGNDRVMNFHKKFGAIEFDRNELDVFFRISYESIRKSMIRFSKYLPDE